MIAVLPEKRTVTVGWPGRGDHTETETGLRDEAGQPGAVRPPPPAHSQEAELHTED